MALNMGIDAKLSKMPMISMLISGENLGRHDG
jgi:hypothetical protein